MPVKSGSFNIGSVWVSPRNRVFHGVPHAVSELRRPGRAAVYLGFVPWSEDQVQVFAAVLDKIAARKDALEILEESMAGSMNLREANLILAAAGFSPKGSKRGAHQVWTGKTQSGQTVSVSLPRGGSARDLSPNMARNVMAAVRYAKGISQVPVSANAGQSFDVESLDAEPEAPVAHEQPFDSGTGRQPTVDERVYGVVSGSLGEVTASTGTAASGTLTLAEPVADEDLPPSPPSTADIPLPHWTHMAQGVAHDLFGLTEFAIAGRGEPYPRTWHADLVELISFHQEVEERPFDANIDMLYGRASKSLLLKFHPDTYSWQAYDIVRPFDFIPEAPAEPRGEEMTRNDQPEGKTVAVLFDGMEVDPKDMADMIHLVKLLNSPMVQRATGKSVSLDGLMQEALKSGIDMMLQQSGIRE